MKQTSLYRTLAAATIMLALAGPANAQAADNPAPQRPAVVDVMAASMTATVADINHETRVVTLKDDEGNISTMTAGPEVARLKEVKKGDRVKIDYLESIAVVVQPADMSISSAEGNKRVLVRNQSKKPSGSLTETEVITATVVSIDAKKRTAVLRGPKGKEMKIDIAPDVTNIENVKKGDQVLLSVTRTIAIAVEKAGK